MKLMDFSRHSEQTVSCFIFAKSAQTVLLLQRSSLEDYPSQWCLPGGHVEADESYFDAALRECREETGIDLSGKDHLLIYKIRIDWPLTTNWVYAFEIEDEIEPVLNWESDAYAWFTLDQLPQPLHWTLESLLSSDSAAERLHKLIKL